MSIPTASEFLKMLAQGGEAVSFAFGAIDTDYTLGNPKILFDGETTISTKTYPFLASYAPTADDRVILAKVSGSYVVLGKFDGAIAGGGGPTTVNITVGTITTGDAGTDADVSNSGTTTNLILDFTIPRGAAGATGATGATGPQGPAGADGEAFGNIDGGSASSTYGGTSPMDGGSA